MRDEICEILGDKSERKIRYKTWAVGFEDGSVGIIHHHTIIVRYRPDGSVKLSTGGWYSRTTKERLNNWMPPGWNIYQQDYQWYLCHGRDEYEYRDGMIIHPGGLVTYEELT